MWHFILSFRVMFMLELEGKTLLQRMWQNILFPSFTWLRNHHTPCFSLCLQGERYSDFRLKCTHKNMSYCNWCPFENRALYAKYKMLTIQAWVNWFSLGPTRASRHPPNPLSARGSLKTGTRSSEWWQQTPDRRDLPFIRGRLPCTARPLSAPSLRAAPSVPLGGALKPDNR